MISQHSVQFYTNSHRLIYGDTVITADPMQQLSAQTQSQGREKFPPLSSPNSSYVTQTGLLQRFHSIYAFPFVEVIAVTALKLNHLFTDNWSHYPLQHMS